MKGTAGKQAIAVDSISLERDEFFERLALADDSELAAFDQNFREQSTRVVVRRHGRAVGAGIQNRQQIARLQFRKPAVGAKDVR